VRVVLLLPALLRPRLRRQLGRRNRGGPLVVLDAGDDSVGVVDAQCDGWPRQPLPLALVPRPRPVDALLLLLEFGLVGVELLEGFPGAVGDELGEGEGQVGGVLVHLGGRERVGAVLGGIHPGAASLLCVAEALVEAVQLSLELSWNGEDIPCR